MIVKVCGVRSVEQAQMVLRAGADWVGLNLVGGPRRIDLATAVRIVRAMDDPDRAVVLWELVASDGANAENETSCVLERLLSLGVRRVQIYGVQRAADLRCLSERGVETILVRHVRDELSIAACRAFLVECGAARPEYVLLDGVAEGQLGGTGRCVNWELLRECREAGCFDGWPPIILAGGLNPANVAEAIDRVRPAAVDVSSGVESSPGTKDEEKVRAFVQAVRGFQSTSRA